MQRSLEDPFCGLFARVIATVKYHFVIAVWKGKGAESAA
jgi:hypothetical protein